MASAFYTWDVAKDRIAWTGRLDEVLGFAPEETPDRLERWMRLVHPEDRQPIERHIEECLSQQSAFHLTYRVRNQNGGYHHVCDEGDFLSPELFLGSVSNSQDVATGEALIEQVTRVTALGLLIVDNRGVISFANHNAAAVFGYDRESLVGQSVELLVPDALRPQHRESRLSYGRDLPHRLVNSRTVQGRRRDGTCIPVAVGLNPLQSPSDSVACTILDLTEFQQADRDFARFFALSLDLFCIAGFDGRFRRVNPNFTRILGYSETQLLSRPFLDFVHPDDQEATEREVARLADGRDTIAFRNRYRDIAGHYLWFEWAARPVPSEDVIYAVARDVTHQVLMEQRLRNQESRERAILDNTAAVIRIEDLQGRYQFVNREFTRVFGVEAEASVGRTAEQLLTPALAQQLQRQSAPDSGWERTPLREEIIQLADDVQRNFITSRIPLNDPNGRPSGVAYVSTDITDQILAQDARQQMQLARTVQQKLYPSRPPVIPGFDVAGLARPVTHLCGDYYDYIPAPDGRHFIVVGDVSGHGLGPALQMVELRALVRTLLRRSGSLVQIFTEINHLLCADLPESMFISLFIAEVNPNHRSFRYLGAGHVAWLVRSSGETHQFRSTGTVLGIVPTARFDESPLLELGVGDVLLLSTDGVTEAMSPGGDLFGKERLLESVARHQAGSASQILEGIFGEVQVFVSTRPVKDDMTAIVIKAV